MFIVFVLLCLASSAIWINYFKEVNVLEISKLPYVILLFTLGASLYLPNYYIGQHLSYFDYFNYSILNKLIDSIIRIGFFNEGLKLTAIYIVYLFFKKELKDPVSIFVFFTVSALGFSFSGNIYHVLETDLYVFNEYSILNTLNQILCSSLVSFAVINFRYYNKSIPNVLLYLLIAVFLSGLYDFWLFYERNHSFGVIVSILYFLFFISFFANGLTNTLNISSNFSYLKFEIGNQVYKRMFNFFLILIFIQFISFSLFKNFTYSKNYLVDTLWFSLVILFFSIKRLSKLKVVEGKWTFPKVELPFTFFFSDSFHGRKPKLKFKFRGETFNEKIIDFYLNVYCSINPLSKRNSFILKPKDTFLAKKMFFKNEETFYLAHVIKEGEVEMMLLKPKNTGKNLIKNRHAICSLLSIPEGVNINEDKNNLSSSDFIFREWVFVKYR